MNEAPIPENVAPFVEVLGVDGAVAFLLKFGGAPIYFATDPKNRSAVAGFLGHTKAAALAKRIGPGEVYVPTAKPFCAAVLKARGLSGAEIARRLHVSHVTVRGYLAKADDRQLNLFA